MSLPKRLQLALQQMDFDDGFEFERFANAFLAAEIPELRPVAGMHDGARDAFIYSSDRAPGTFVQTSVTAAFEKKIRSTVRSLKTNGHPIRELVYCSSKDIVGQPEADALRRELRSEGVSLDIRDQRYFVTFCNVDVGRIAASEEVSKRHADPLFADRNALAPSPLALTDDEQRTASAFLTLELSEKDPGKAPTKFAYEALVQFALRDASPEAPLHRAKVHDFVARFVELTEPARVKTLTNAVLARLVDHDAVKHHKEDWVLAGGNLLGSERLRADQYDVAEPPDAIQKRSQLLQDDLEALAVGHGSSSAGGRLLA